MAYQATETNRSTNGYNGIERRGGLRIAMPFPVRVRGLSPAGKRLEFETELENLGPGGMFLRSSHDIRNWKNLTLVMRLSLASDPATPAPIVAARARILRTEPSKTNRTGFAVGFTRHRFM